MNNYDLANDEVILYKTKVTTDDTNGILELTLTSKKIIFEQTKTKKIKLFKTQDEIIIADEIVLKNIKIYNGKAQIKQKNSNVYIQTIEKNFNIKFESVIDAMKFTTKITDAITGTSISERGTEKIKETINKVDDILGFSTRDTIKGVIENGVAGTLLKGIKTNKK